MKSISFRRIARGIAPWLIALGAAVATAAHAQNSPSPLAGEGRGEGATNNVVSFEIPAQELSSALIQFSDQTGIQVVTSGYDVVDHVTNGVSGTHGVTDALNILLEGTGLTFQRVSEDTISLARPQGAVAGQNTIGQRRPGIEEIIVTGQKREERIQDVPIAISAFTQEDLTTQQIAGGPDLITQIPNFAFTKTNFTGYSIQIRGIGTQAVSATTDPAVAVALNNTPFIRNRFFEQEFYDMERVEVLRGPQGTLFGRNATAGVVNLITAKPKFQHESMLSLDHGNYNSRRWEAMVNLPVVEDKMALRIAAAGTKRDGYAVNELTDSPIDGRDLWSSRVSLRFAPNDRLDMNLIWERFEEDDDRIRSGKQLCKTDEVTEVAGFPTTHFQTLPNNGQATALFAGVQPRFSQGCKRNSLYAKDSFQTVNGLMLPYYLPLSAIGLQTALTDPYASRSQSRDLRVIESTVDPEYKARSNIGELQINYQLTDNLTLDSETGYLTDFIFSTQDFNRFNTASGAWPQPGNNTRPGSLLEGPNGGVFCDPQVGCADRLVAVDLSTAESTQFSQEFRLSSQFDGPFNFNLGVNYLRYDTEDKYYVFINSVSQIAAVGQSSDSQAFFGENGPLYIPSESTNEGCLVEGPLPGDPSSPSGGREGCLYMDPNPIGSLNDQGHNYFLSKNPFRLDSYGIFGEAYWNITDALKLTAGLRWSVDEKKAPLHPTWIFVSGSAGHPVSETIEQEWREPTGRLVLDWKPQLDFTDETLLYGSIARGYKGGGANPPPYVGRQTTASLTRPQTFDAEFVNAFEVGAKNTLADGAVTLNVAAFYYDYTDYQISEIVDRSAFNQNYDAEVWGGEIEADWWLRENLRLGFKGGYQKTRIGDGERAIDLMDRTAGRHFTITDIPNPDFDPSQEIPRSEYVAGYNWDDISDGQEFFAYDEWLVVRPFPIFPSSCILPAYLFEGVDSNTGDPILADVGSGGGAAKTGCDLAYINNVDPVTEASYVPNPDGSTLVAHSRPDDYPYPGWDPATAPNNGEGFAKDLGGNELPNAPNYTATISGDYIIPMSYDWSLTLHTDIHWQSESWWRIFNDHEYNHLNDYFTMNLAAILEGGDGWHIMGYIKNVTDETAITGAFLNSDDTGLTSNVFLTEPRLYGLRVTKRWNNGGGPAKWIGGTAAALLGKEPDEPSPWSLTVGGQLLRPNEARVETYMPTFITEFDPNIDPTSLQTGDMDWGDGREIVLSHAAGNGWRFSLGARFGESSRKLRETLIGEPALLCPMKYETCEPGGYPSPYYDFVYEYDAYERDNYGLTELAEKEEHLLVDFTVGRDVGLGGITGVLSAGLRYAHFESSTNGLIRGTPDRQDGECYSTCFDFSTFSTYSIPAPRNEYRATVEASREFQGIGPAVSWESSSRLFGDDNAHLDVDWSLSGGVLFGRQDTSVEGVEEGQYFLGSRKYSQIDLDPESSYSTSFSHERDDDGIVTVPTIGAGLGLTYRIDGGSISAGYSWERYYGVIDGGIEERKSFDRTIDGPYLKVTFGGGS